MAASLEGSGGNVLAAAKIYVCKICGESFSSGRVLGGHVRGRHTQARSTVRKMMSPVLAVKSESDSCLTDRAGHGGGGGGCDPGKRPRKSVKSILLGEQKIDSWRREYLCALCGKGFGSRNALFGHMKVHTGSKKRVKGRSYKRDPSSVVQVPSLIIKLRKSVVQEPPSNCKIVSPSMRRKRSRRVMRSENEPVKNAPPKFSEDEKEAAAGLLMLSEGAVSRTYSGDIKNSSGFYQIGNLVQVLDDLLAGVGDKRRFDEVDDTAPKKLKLSGDEDSLVINSIGKVKVTECRTSGEVTCGGIEHQSIETSNIVEKMRSLTVDVLEGESLPALSSDDELEGGNGKRIVPDTCCRKVVVTFERRVYKRRSCNKIFSTHPESGKHWIMGCSSSENPEKTDNKEGASCPATDNGRDMGLLVDGVGGQSLSGCYCSHDNKESEAATGNKDVHGVPLPDLNIPVEVLE